MSADPYVYPGTNVLINKLGLKTATELDRAERLLVVQRASEDLPIGDFDLAHLRAIHRHLFQDLYDWAGELRMVEISKDGDQFQFRQYLETGLADVHRRLKSANMLRGLSSQDFSREAGQILGDVNYVHPFREGNGRAQLYYLEQLANQAGHPIDLSVLDPTSWISASRAAQNADYRPMSVAIGRAIKTRPEP